MHLSLEKAPGIEPDKTGLAERRQIGQNPCSQAGFCADGDVDRVLWRSLWRPSGVLGGPFFVSGAVSPVFCRDGLLLRRRGPALRVEDQSS